MTTFTPVMNPSVGLSRQVTARTLDAGFGDGYTQRAGDGLNTIPRVLSLSWDMLEPTDADDIEAFFVAQAGYRKFDWTDPRDGSPGQFICRTWTRTSPTGMTDAISATFEKVFDL
jgi:phage-related protein